MLLLSDVEAELDVEGVIVSLVRFVICCGMTELLNCVWLKMPMEHRMTWPSIDQGKKLMLPPGLSLGSQIDQDTLQSLRHESGKRIVRDQHYMPAIA